ncbi:hypothetical protein B0H10DRAFT_2044480 [Mycena sp. CBHHK59/15]|nr:hypothetical protein B0H10DRAFT_2044480 [Mycena sp. CBHHK59/15]
MDSSHVILSELQVVAYVKGAFLALLVYDTLLQINQEYLHVWKSRWTLIKCLYLWTRYSTFVDTTMALLHIVHANASVCNHSMMFTTIFSGFGIGITEMILMVRTYTLYERSKKLLAFFFLLWFSVGGVSFWAAIKWTAQFRPATSSEVPECNLGDLVGTVCYISLLVGETVIVFLTLWKCFRRFSPHNSGLLNSFYRDGVWFYLAILPFTVGTVVALFVAPAGLNSIMDTPLRRIETKTRPNLIDIPIHRWISGRLWMSALETMYNIQF